jgi:hypothetical protein
MGYPKVYLKVTIIPGGSASAHRSKPRIAEWVVGVMSSITQPKRVWTVAQAFALPINAFNYAASEPVLTGGLLYLLTRGPPHIRERILQPFATNLLSKDRAARIASLVAVLKVFTIIGVGKRISSALNRLALNNWSLGRPGAPFKFGDSKEEVVVITGGSSGFGYEMVKGFSKNARVVVLDILPFPPELAECKPHMRRSRFFVF